MYTRHIRPIRKSIDRFLNELSSKLINFQFIHQDIKDNSAIHHFFENIIKLFSSPVSRETVVIGQLWVVRKLN